MIQLTEPAANQIRQQLDSDPEGKGLALRLAVKTGDDGAFQYAMGFDKAVEDDIKTRHFGVTCVAGVEYTELLHNCTVDYVELEPGQWSFVFLNPNDPAYVPPGE